MSRYLLRPSPSSPPSLSLIDERIRIAINIIMRSAAAVGSNRVFTCACLGTYWCQPEYLLVLIFRVSFVAMPTKEQPRRKICKDWATYAYEAVLQSFVSQIDFIPGLIKLFRRVKRSAVKDRVIRLHRLYKYHDFFLALFKVARSGRIDCRDLTSALSMLQPHFFATKQ